MYCSIFLEYTIRGDVVVVATVVDVILIKECKSLVGAVVVYVVEYFVLNFVELFVVYFVSGLVVSSCKNTCNLLCNNIFKILLWYAYCY